VVELADRRAPMPLHGGLLDDELAALGLRPDEVLDLSVNVNPYGPCPSLRRALAAARVDRYPDPRSTAARRAFAERAGVAFDRVALGNGAVDLMWTLARAVLSPGDRVLVVEPAFSEMRTAAARAGATVLEQRALPERDFAIDLGALDAAVGALAPRIVYACSPQNPAALCTPLVAFEELARRHPGSLFVIDLSFLSLSVRHAEHAEVRDPRVVWLRSLTKDHALAGLRVGAAMAPPEIVTALEQQRPPWSVNALAQAAVVAACTDEATRFVDESRARLLADREALDATLRAEGLRVHRSETIYSLVDVGPHFAATELRARLLTRHHILVRDATTFGLPHHVRIAARAAADRERLVLALRQELQQ
jgi:histidinol-phosphate/aromatic aminotransferase/cobyric acid decarboxylase-like protein